MNHDMDRRAAEPNGLNCPVTGSPLIGDSLKGCCGCETCHHCGRSGPYCWQLPAKTNR